MVSLFKGIVLAVALLLPAAGAAAGEGPWTTEHPLVVVHSAQTPPMAYLGFNGEAKRLLVDYWRLWSKVNGVPIKVVLVDWPETLRMVRDGEADLHAGLFYSDERAQTLDFAPPFFNLDAALAVRAGLHIRSMDELGDRTLGVLDKGYSAYYVRSRYPELNRKEYSSAADLVAGAVAGEVDAMIIERITLVHLLGELGKLGEFRMQDVLYSQEVHPAVAKGKKALLELVERGMLAIPAKERERTFRRWTIPTGSATPWLSMLLGMAVAVALGLVVFLLFQRRAQD